MICKKVVSKGWCKESSATCYFSWCLKKKSGFAPSEDSDQTGQRWPGGSELRGAKPEIVNFVRQHLIFRVFLEILTKFLHAVYLCIDRYMGPMSRDTAAERLKAQPNGTFLVRDSENPARRGYPALSIKYVSCL